MPSKSLDGKFTLFLGDIMGYDSTITIYDINGKYIEDIVDDISFRAILNLIRFSRDKQLSKQEYNQVCMFGDINCSINTAKKFLYDCEKNGVMNDDDYYWDIHFAKQILANKRVYYYSITSV